MIHHRTPFMPRVDFSLGGYSMYHVSPCVLYLVLYLYSPPLSSQTLHNRYRFALHPRWLDDRPFFQSRYPFVTLLSLTIFSFFELNSKNSLQPKNCNGRAFFHLLLPINTSRYFYDSDPCNQCRNITENSL